MSNPLIKTKADLLNLNIPIPGWQGSTEEAGNQANFGRRSYNPTTATFSTQDPVANGVSYQPFGNQVIVGSSHGIGRGNEYSINNQNSLSSREWDGYCFLGFHTDAGACEEANFIQNATDRDGSKQKYFEERDPRSKYFNLEKQVDVMGEINAKKDINRIQPFTIPSGPGSPRSVLASSLCEQRFDCREKQIQNISTQLGGVSEGNYLSSETYYKNSYFTYIPNWRDYAGSAEKLSNDRLESEVAFANICKTDTVYPYGCNEHHSLIAKNYDTSVSPSVRGLVDYKRANTQVFSFQVEVTNQYFDESKYLNDVEAYNRKIADYESKVNSFNQDLATYENAYEVLSKNQQLYEEMGKLQPQLNLREKNTGFLDAVDPVQSFNRCTGFQASDSGIDRGLDCVSLVPVGKILKVAKVGKIIDKVANGAKVTNNVANSQLLLKGGQEPLLLENTRTKLLRQVKNQKLRNTVNELYRPGGKIGSGSAMDAYRFEKVTGELVGGKSHAEKMINRQKNIENILQKENLSSTDRKIAEDLLRDIINTQK